MLFVFKSSQSIPQNMFLLGVIKDLPLTRKSCLMASKIIEKKFLNIKTKKKKHSQTNSSYREKAGERTDFCPLLVKGCY